MELPDYNPAAPALISREDEATPGDTSPSLTDDPAVDGGGGSNDVSTQIKVAQPPALAECSRSLSEAVLENLSVVCDQSGEGFLQIDGGTTVHRLADSRAKLLLARLSAAAGNRQRPAELQTVMDDLAAYAQLWAPRLDVWCRVAPIVGGIELDIGDEADTRIQVTADGVEIGRCRDGPLFYRTPSMRPYVLPAASGNFDLIDAYLNLTFQERTLLKLWIAYTIASPRLPTTVYVILLLVGPQGSGKSLLGQMLAALINPSSVGIQSFPRNPLDLAIATRHGLCIFDNLRSIPPWMADALCMTSTSGAVTGRKLYSNDEQVAVGLHGPLVLNSLHGGIVSEPDLAERCLQLNLQPLDSERRWDPAVLIRQFERDRPAIFRGLLNQIAEIFRELPTAEASSPTRMFAFSTWIAAAERVDGVPEGSYQKWYAESLTQVTLDALLESSVGAALLDFIDTQPDGSWTGTAAELLDALGRAHGRRGAWGGDWPVNEIALSRRLRSLIGAFRGQGIDIRFTRGRRRQITIVRVRGGNHK